MKLPQLELPLTKQVNRWGVMWHSENKLDGLRKHLIFGPTDGGATLPILFRTRQEARDHINKRWGYIKDRKDLREEPHGWRLPKAVRVECSFKFQEWPYVQTELYGEKK